MANATKAEIVAELRRRGQQFLSFASQRNPESYDDAKQWRNWTKAATDHFLSAEMIEKYGQETGDVEQSD